MERITSDRCSQKLRVFAVAALLFALAGCGGGGGGGGLTAQAPAPSATPAPNNNGGGTSGGSSGIVLAGKVVDTDGNAIAGAAVKLPDGSTATSGADGSFTYSAGSATEVKVSATRGGYEEAFDTFHISSNMAQDGKVGVTVTMRRAAATAAEATNASITRADGSAVDVTPTAVSSGGVTYYESVVTIGATDRAVEFTTPAPSGGGEPSVSFTLGSADGSGANAAAVLGKTGQVTASVSYGDPTDMDDLAVFPGDFTTNSDTGFGGSGEGALITAGFARISLKDAAGNPITKFADGTAATIEMTVPEGVVNPETGLIVKPGDTIPIFIFNEDTGEWVVEHEVDGSVKRSTVQNDNTGRMFVKFTTTHLTVFNLDWKSGTCPSESPKVRFVDEAGAPVSGVYVYSEFMGWSYYKGVYIFDSEVSFRNAPSNMQGKIWAVKDGRTSSVATINGCNNTTSVFKPPVPACYSAADCNDNKTLTYDKCINPGVPTAYCLNNACTSVCSSAAQCDDGKSATTDTCENAGTCTAFCKHVSCAVACSSDSSCNDGNSLTVDTCGNAGTCSAACTHSSCTPACNTSAQCDDGNPLTLDACSSGGTCSASCTHTACTAACSANSDCNDNNALTTDTCNNAGTCSAACRNTACSVACSNDAACNDNNALTIDACNNAGTCSSACTHTNCTVACANDAACNDNNALTTDVCNNAGTCAAACSHTACAVACSANSECNDGNPNTTDVCANGGTCSAACAHPASTCSLSLNKVNYAPGETMTITFTVANAGSSAVLCGAESALKNGHGATSWNSFSENLYVTIPANTATTTLTMNKVVPLDWTGTDTSQGSDYDMYPVHFGGERWASGDNFNLHFKRAACSANSECDDNNAATTDTCINPALYDAACVNASCTPVCTTNTNCDDGNPLTLDVCGAPATCSAACSNTACTPACTADANCNDNNPLTSDACASPNTCVAACSFTPCSAACINDANCDDGNPLTADSCTNANTCSAACSNTACTPACTADAQCNDSNALTNDSCGNPNTCAAACVNAACTPACTANSDCNDGNVLTNDSCSNPGTCAAACINAACTPACASNGDCNDGNALTNDSCSNPNTCTAACSNTACTPACTIDADCNDSNALTNDVCNNPNTCAAACSNTACTPACTSDANCDDSNALTNDSCASPNTCTAVCNHAACTPACTSDANCNDGNANTLDTCSSPNTCAAACSNTPLPNTPPTVSASASVTTGAIPLTVTFTATCSDADGACMAYSWNFGDGSPATGTLNASHTYTTPGTFDAVLTVTDDEGATSRATRTISAYQTPSGSIAASVSSGAAPLLVNFTSTCTDDVSCVSYMWNFGDGSPTSSLQNPSHTFNSDGIYLVTLTLTDNDGHTSNINAIVTAGIAGAKLSSGYEYNCAITSAGGVKCWGDNTFGQLGDGTVVKKFSPVDVTGLTSGVVAISAGYYHTCAVTSGGGVKCWGKNEYGQLGNGTLTNSSVPVDVSGLPVDMIGVSTGYNHTCAHTAGGAVKCWGYNGIGQLGRGNSVNSSTPVDPIGMTSGVASVAVGGEFTCALTTAGGVKCWGMNNAGQLGSGATASYSYVPVDVSGLTSGVSAIAPSVMHTCALLAGGGVKCWGYNLYGQLGDGTNTDKRTPVDVAGISSGITGLYASSASSHTCVTLSTGGAKCWGYNADGQLGDGTTVNRPTPVNATVFPANIVSIGTGRTHNCALVSGGAIKCWGNSGLGQIGNGVDPAANVLAPANVTVESQASFLFGGNHNTCAIVSGGLKCWGYSLLGTGNTSSDASTTVTGLASGVSKAAGGSTHSCAVTTSGGVKCWGRNWYGELGSMTDTAAGSAVPVDVSGLSSGISDVIAGEDHSCALTTAGGVKCWGDGWYGTLGSNTTNISGTPVDVYGLTSGVAAISGNAYLTCALTTAGGVKCWGANWDGQIGNGTFDNAYLPVDVSGLTSGVAAITANGSHACALTTGGGVKCWGANMYGQLGNGTFISSSTPVDVSGLTSGVASLVHINGAGSCAITTGGALMCWGYNADGQLGNGTVTDSNVPVNVSGLSSGVIYAAGGYYHTCVIMADSSLKCWGKGGYHLGLPGYNGRVPNNVLGF